MNNKFILKHALAPGDVVVSTALVRDLKLTYGNDIHLDVRMSWPQLYDNNPYLTPMREQKDKAELVVLKYTDGIRASNNGSELHFLSYFHKFFEERTGYAAPVLFAKPDLHLTKFELENRPVNGRYWLMFGGGKADMTTKHWRYSWYAEVANMLKERGVTIAQSGAIKKGHTHPPIAGIFSLVGWGGMREWLWQIYHSEGVIGPITGAMHVAAAFDKPCVVIAGGREKPSWEWYGYGGNFSSESEPVKVPHRFLHTFNQLPCCMGRGCWKSYVSKTEPKSKPDKICERVIYNAGPQPLPECMQMITPQMVVDAVMSYYDDGTLPPPAGDTLTLSTSAQLVASLPVMPPPMPIPTARIQSNKKLELFDHPEIGGKLTVCVLAYGEYTHLIKRCLTTLLDSFPVERLDLRVACNAVSPETLEYMKGLPITKLYVNEHNDKKYPVQRKMLHDVTCPITTNYFMWLDDDTYVVNRAWSVDLAENIIANYKHNVGLYGDLAFHKLEISPTGYDQRTWFREAAWYKQSPFCDRRGNITPNGEWIKFGVGWCWVMKTEAARICQVPDSRLSHNGDMAAGAALMSNGYALKQWNPRKSLIATIPPGNRRGASERFPWKLL